jgi:type I restriction enzyme M protein
MDLIQEGIKKGIISFDAKQKNIIYTHQNKGYDYTDPEEKIRCIAFLELVLNYGYETQHIDFEVKAKQGSSGKTSADIVIYYPNDVPKKAFYVIEIKAANTKDKEDDVRKQARSYARSEEINTQYFAYKIGDNPFKAYKINGKDTEVKIPYQYNKDKVYAYLVEGTEIDEKQAHYTKLQPSTPYDLKRIFSQCHNIIWQSGEKNKQKSLDEFNKILFLKMFDELEREKNEKQLEKYVFQTFSLETKSQLKDRIEKHFQDAAKERKVTELLKPINLDAQQIYDIVEKLQPYSLLETDKDPKGLAFETFVENYMKGDFGQFFTPRNIVEFMVNISPVIWDTNFNSNSKFLDPCCGSGSFITQIITTFKDRFKKKDNHIAFTNNSVFGIEINDDISVSAKINFALHDNGHDNIKNANGLNLKKFDWKTTEFDLILTNPPFGGEPTENRSADKNKDLANMSRFYDYENFEITKKQIDAIEEVRKVKKVTKEKETKEDKPNYTDSIRPEYIFLELFYKALKENGIVEVVVPDGLLTNSSVQYIRDFMLEKFKILAVISLPQYAFSHYGAGVKASILVLKKLPYKTSQAIKAAKQKHLKIAVKQHEKTLKNLEEQKKNLTNQYELIIKINQEYTEQERVIKESSLFNEASKKHLETLQKETIQKTKVIQSSENFKIWEKEQKVALNEQINDLKELIYAQADENFTQFEPDFQYPIFMAIAERIGYDATGRETSQNDLPTIAAELIEFLKQEQNGQDSFFV